MNPREMIEHVAAGTSPRVLVKSLTEVSLSEVDQHAVRELVLWIDNDQQLYKAKVNDFAKNLITKVARGQYDKNKAAKLMLYLADRAAQSYTKEFGSKGASSFGIFDRATRVAVAKELVSDFEDEAKEGEYEDLLPKKYKGKLEYPLIFK